MTQKTMPVLIALVFMIAACSTVPITGRKQFSFIPSSQMNSMADSSFRQLLGESKLSADLKTNQMVAEIGGRIALSAEHFLRENGMASEVADYKWEFKVIDAPDTVNAFCMPGGKVAIYTGILPVTKDADGLAVVIGHEVAHAIAKHGNERMSQQLLLQFGGLALAEAVKKKPEKTQQIYMSVFGLGSQYGLLLPYSREHEYEADHIGLIISARAGYNPEAAVVFWETMASSGGGRTPEFLSTHPAPANRIEAIKKEIPEAMKYYKK